MYSKKIQVDTDKASSFIDGLNGDYDVSSNEGFFSAQPYQGESVEVLIIPEATPQNTYPTVVAGESEESVKGYITERGW